jgi:transcriptional regulator
MNDREERFYNLCALLAVCPITEIQIILLLRRYFCGLTLRQISRDYGCTFENIRLQNKSAMEKIEKHYKLKNRILKIKCDI